MEEGRTPAARNLYRGMKRKKWLKPRNFGRLLLVGNGGSGDRKEGELGSLEAEAALINFARDSRRGGQGLRG